MAQAPSIEKVLKASKNLSGLQNEIYFSKIFHEEGIPLLISSQLLRSKNMGQIDLCRLNTDREGKILEIAEVKSSEIGVLEMESAQKRRLFVAQKFLASLLGYRTKLVSLVR